MFQRDAGNDGQLRDDNVCSVKPSAESGFPNYEIDLFLGEQNDGDRGRDLKISRSFSLKPHGFDDRPDFVRRKFQRCVVHDGSVEAEPLCQRDEMGRGIESGRISASAQSVFQKCAYGPFAVASGDMKKLQVPFRIAEPFQKIIHPVETEVDGEEPDRVQPVKIHDDARPLRNRECPTSRADSAWIFRRGSGGRFLSTCPRYRSRNRVSRRHDGCRAPTTDFPSRLCRD